MRNCIARRRSAGPAGVSWSCLMYSFRHPVRPFFLNGFSLEARFARASSRSCIILGVICFCISSRRRCRSRVRASAFSTSMGRIFSLSFSRRRAESGNTGGAVKQAAAVVSCMDFALRQNASASCCDAGSPKIRCVGSGWPWSRSCLRRSAASPWYSSTNAFQPCFCARITRLLMTSSTFGPI